MLAFKIKTIEKICTSFGVGGRGTYDFITVCSFFSNQKYQFAYFFPLKCLLIYACSATVQCINGYKIRRYIDRGNLTSI